MMTQAEFRNGLCLLRSLDAHELPKLSVSEWKRFRDDPAFFFLKLDDERAGSIWQAMEKRGVNKEAA